jgi:hypothetical protein
VYRLCAWQEKTALSITESSRKSIAEIASSTEGVTNLRKEKEVEQNDDGNY